MKRLLTILLLALIPLSGFSQKNFKMSQEDKKILGWGMIIGGATVTVGVAVTPMEYTGGINSVRKPIHEQSAHLAGFITGPSVSIGGALTLLFNSKRHRKYKRRW